MKFRALVVGLGRIGMGYDLDLPGGSRVFSHARAFSTHPEFELTAGVDGSAERRELFEARFGAPAFATVEEAMARRAADVVAVAVPTVGHATVVQQVLASGAPTVILCEKPLADDPAAAAAIVDACEARDVTLFVNYVRRSDPAVIEVRRRLLASEIRGPMKGVVWYSKGFLHNGSHYFDVMQFWLGPVQAWKVIDRGRALPHGDAEPDVRLTFTGGDVMFLAAREEAFSHYTAELVAENGRVRYERLGGLMEWQPVIQSPELPGYSVLSDEAERLQTGRDRFQWHVTDQLSAFLRGGPAHLCTGAEALRTLESMRQILDTP